MVGKLIGANRHDWVLASKLGNSMGKAPNQSHYSRHWMTHEVNQSLRRLNTEHLDILYLHRDFHEENLDEAVRTLGDLISADRTSDVEGQRVSVRVDLGGRSILKKKKESSRHQMAS